MMKRQRPIRITEIFVFVSIYPLLTLIAILALLTCGLVATMALRLANTDAAPAVTGVQRPASRAAATPPGAEINGGEGGSGEAALLPGAQSADAAAGSQNQADVSDQADVSPRRRRPTASPPANLIDRLLSAFRTGMNEPPAHPPRPRALKVIPPPMPTSTLTPTATPTAVPSPTYPPPTQTPTSAGIPIVYPASGAVPVANPGVGAIPVVYLTPGPAPLPIATLVPTPAVSPTSTATPLPQYDFMLAEFFNSPTTNNFLMVYVAIVDIHEIPIGGMKIVGTRLDHNLTYESPLSNWHFEGYSAPGQVIKSGSVKFEPPGGIETSSWVLHLEDAHGNRQSDDIPFEVDENSKQWYFIKFRRRF